jgi:hypothetical protein
MGRKVAVGGCGPPAKIWSTKKKIQLISNRMSEQATVQTVSDDEPSADDEDMHVEEQSSKK